MPANKQALLDLAARVAGLGGPDRVVDFEIADALRKPRSSDRWAGETLAKQAKRYTASLDAAMSLIPAGWHTFFASQDRHSGRWKWELRCAGFKASVRAESAALAVTSAALRARSLASMENDNHG